MTVTQEAIIWTDPSDGYTIHVVRFGLTRRRRKFSI